MCYWFAEKMLAEHTEEFELGKRYLAKMMDADPENFTQENIDVCIAQTYNIYCRSLQLL